LILGIPKKEFFLGIWGRSWETFKKPFKKKMRRRQKKDAPHQLVPINKTPLLLITAGFSGQLSRLPPPHK